MSAIQHIVLLHGWGCDSRIWQHALPFFNRYASTTAIDITYLNEGQAYSLDQLCDVIADQIPENSLLCGWSLGGMLATQVAARYPDKVTGLITLASNAVFVADEHWADAMPVDTFAAFFSLFEAKPAQALKRFMLLEVRGDEQAKQQQSFLQSLVGEPDYEDLKHGLVLLKTINNIHRVEAVHCPALFCFGENDALVSSKTADAFKGQSRSGQSVVVLPNSGHLLHYPNERLSEYLSSFLSGLCDQDG